MRLAILFFFIPFIVNSQVDSNVFTQDELLWYVKNYHPISLQSNLIVKKGESQVRQSRGGFDPYIHASYNDKFYSDNNYYRLLNGGIKIPTWYGVELKTGIDKNDGVFLNPENNVPDGGLWYGGVSVSLGNGLFIDSRRASLRQAQLYAESTFAEQQQLMNDLYFEAIKAYWQWVESWNNLKVYEDALDLALFRFESIKRSYFVGDLPAIDTLEAKIQVQNRTISRNEFLLDYKNKTLELSNFLWFDNNTPLELTDKVTPPDYNYVNISPTLSLDSIEKSMSQLFSNHPEMKLYEYKVNTLNIERRLKAESLKPKLDLNYNFLTEATGNEFYTNISNENYKWGFTFSFPIFLRSERGALQLSKLKIQETELEQKLTLYKLKNNLQAIYNNQLNLEKQIILYRSVVVNYDNMLLGERKKFEMGESSLFLVNNREIKMIEARLKYIELIANYNISEAALIRATGFLYRN